MSLTAPRPSLFQPGDTIQEYCLQHLRGASISGFVWEAENPQGKRYALKFLPNPEQTGTRQEIRAIQMVAPLAHEHLAPVERVWTIPKFFVVAMPLASASLQDLFDAYQAEYGLGIEPVELCEHLTQVAAALDFLNLHKHQLGSWPGGVQHGNIKPSNLLLFGDIAKVADFNLASPTARCLPYGSRLGTLGYIAPEVWNGRLADTTDQYSLAVTYCYLRGGRLPIIEKQPQAGQSAAPRPPPDLSMLSANEHPIIRQALSPAWRDRWASCAKLMANLTAAVRSV